MQPCSQSEQLYLSGAGPPDQLFSRLISVTGYKSPSASRCNRLRIKHEPKALQLRLAGESDWKSLFEFIDQPLKWVSYGILLIWRLWFFKGGFVPVRMGRLWFLGFLRLRFERDFIHKACRIFTS